MSLQSYPEMSPWAAWAQTGAILKDAPHKAAARLYLSWVLSLQTQQQEVGTWTWSVRSDVAPPPGHKEIFEYDNMNPLALRSFMSDRTALDRYKALITLFGNRLLAVRIAAREHCDPVHSVGKRRTTSRS